LLFGRIENTLILRGLSITKVAFNCVIFGPYQFECLGFGGSNALHCGVSCNIFLVIDRDSIWALNWLSMLVNCPSIFDLKSCVIISVKVWDSARYLLLRFVCLLGVRA
jgi:hypothetical protein